MGGTLYTQTILNAFRKSSAIDLLDTLVAKWPALSVRRRAVGLLKSVVLGRSTFRSVCTSAKLIEIVSRGDALKGVNLVIVNGSDQIKICDVIPDDIAVIYVMHNLEEHYAKTSIDGLPSWQQIILRSSGEVKKCVREEEKILRRASVVVGISIEELDAVRSRNPNLLPVWIPPTFEALAERPSRTRSDRLVIGMLGALDHYPNRAAVEFFIREAWPHADPRTQLLLAGRGTEAFTDRGRRIAGLGLVPKLESFWQDIDVLAVPIRQGAGTNVKVCEALANRVPLLATRLALRGLPAIDDPAVCVVTTPDEWRAALRWDKLLPLAQSQPDAELAALFSPAVSAQALDDALQGLARDRPERVA